MSGFRHASEIAHLVERYSDDTDESAFDELADEWNRGNQHARAAIGKLLVDGDILAFNFVFEETERHVRATATKMFPWDAGMVDECINDCYLRFWEKHDQFVPGRDPLPLLEVIVKNSVIDALRKRRTSNKHVIVSGEVLDGTNTLLPDNDDPVQTAMYDELLADFEDFLSELTDREHDVHTLDQIGASNDQIAAALKISPNYVNNLKSKIKGKLKLFLQK